MLKEMRKIMVLKMLMVAFGPFFFPVFYIVAISFAMNMNFYIIRKQN